MQCYTECNRVAGSSSTDSIVVLSILEVPSLGLNPPLFLLFPLCSSSSLSLFLFLRLISIVFWFYVSFSFCHFLLTIALTFLLMSRFWCTIIDNSIIMVKGHKYPWLVIKTSHIALTLGLFTCLPSFCFIVILTLSPQCFFFVCLFIGSQLFKVSHFSTATQLEKACFNTPPTPFVRAINFCPDNLYFMSHCLFILVLSRSAPLSPNYVNWDHAANLQGSNERAFSHALLLILPFHSGDFSIDYLDNCPDHRYCLHYTLPLHLLSLWEQWYGLLLGLQLSIHQHIQESR